MIPKREVERLKRAARKLRKNRSRHDYWINRVMADFYEAIVRDELQSRSSEPTEPMEKVFKELGIE